MSRTQALLVEPLSRLHLKHAEHAGVEAEITQAIVQQRRLHVVAGLLLRPGDARVTLGYVAGRIGADGVDGPPLAVRVGDDDQSIAETGVGTGISPPPLRRQSSLPVSRS